MTQTTDPQESPTATQSTPTAEGLAAPTKALYHDNAYLSTFEAKIVAVDGHAVALDQTAFYPGGGGQMADRGALLVGGRRLPLARLRKEGDVIWHELATDGESGELLDLATLGLTAGADVQGELDWPFRYHMMRTHTALHILCGLIFRNYGAQVTGGQMYPDRARMDFAMETFTPALIGDIERCVNEAVQEDHPIKVYRLPRAEAMEIPDLIRTKINLLPPTISEIRIVEITGLDLQADGGTHVRSTREVGSVKVIKTENKGKQNKRMEIALVDDE